MAMPGVWWARFEVCNVETLVTYQSWYLINYMFACEAKGTPLVREEPITSSRYSFPYIDRFRM